jgi:hypothetical protein
MRVAVEAANQKGTAGPQNDGNNGRYAPEYRLDRTGLAGANKLKTLPALIRPLGVRPNRLRKEDTYH